MRRRTYLATIGLVTGISLSGCSGNSGGNNSNSNSSGGGGGGNNSGGGAATEKNGGTPTSGGSTARSTSDGTGNETTTGVVVEGTGKTATGTGGTKTPTAMRKPSPTAAMTSMNTATSMSTSGPMTTMASGMGTMMGGGNADVSIDSSELSKQTDSGITDVAMVGKLTAPSYLSSIELQVRFRNDGDDILDTESAYFQGLEKGQTWNFYVPSFASQTPSKGEVEVASATTGQPPSDPGAKVVDSSLNEPKDEFSGPTVTGRAKNTSRSQIPYLEARIKFLADDGTALESDYTNVSNLPTGETWKFKLEAITYSTDPRPDIADYDVTLASGL